jgi:hypothetical protein
MFYSVDRSGLYQTGGTLDLWQQDPVLGRPFWRLPDWFEADDLRAHVAELFPDGLASRLDLQRTGYLAEKIRLQTKCAARRLPPRLLRLWLRHLTWVPATDLGHHESRKRRLRLRNLPFPTGDREIELLSQLMQDPDRVRSFGGYNRWPAHTSTHRKGQRPSPAAGSFFLWGRRGRGPR